MLTLDNLYDLDNRFNKGMNAVVESSDSHVTRGSQESQDISSRDFKESRKESHKESRDFKPRNGVKKIQNAKKTKLSIKKPEIGIEEMDVDVNEETHVNVEVNEETHVHVEKVNEETLVNVEKVNEETRFEKVNEENNEEVNGDKEDVEMSDEMDDEMTFGVPSDVFKAITGYKPDRLTLKFILPTSIPVKNVIIVSDPKEGHFLYLPCRYVGESWDKKTANTVDMHTLCSQNMMFVQLRPDFDVETGTFELVKIQGTKKEKEIIMKCSKNNQIADHLASTLSAMQKAGIDEEKMEVVRRLLVVVDPCSKSSKNDVKLLIESLDSLDRRVPKEHLKDKYLFNKKEEGKIAEIATSVMSQETSSIVAKILSKKQMSWTKFKDELFECMSEKMKREKKALEEKVQTLQIVVKGNADKLNQKLYELDEKNNRYYDLEKELKDLTEENEKLKKRNKLLEEQLYLKNVQDRPSDIEAMIKENKDVKLRNEELTTLREKENKENAKRRDQVTSKTVQSFRMRNDVLVDIIKRLEIIKRNPGDETHVRELAELAEAFVINEGNFSCHILEALLDRPLAEIDVNPSVLKQRFKNAHPDKIDANSDLKEVHRIVWEGVVEAERAGVLFAEVSKLMNGILNGDGSTPGSTGRRSRRLAEKKGL